MSNEFKWRIYQSVDSGWEKRRNKETSALNPDGRRSSRTVQVQVKVQALDILAAVAAVAAAVAAVVAAAEAAVQWFHGATRIQTFFDTVVQMHCNS